MHILQTKAVTLSLFILALGLFFVVETAGAAITYPVSFDDPGGAYSSSYAGITSNLQAAGANWNRYLAGSGSIAIEVQVTTTVPALRARA